MGYSVTVLEAAPQWIAAARGRAKAGAVSRTMLGLLGTAWDFVRLSGIKTDGQNVAIYRGEAGEVAIAAGPRVFEKFEGNSEVACVATPSGPAATAIHMGPYEQLGRPHAAIREWCAANGREMEGTNWEIYGHHEDDPARRRTDVFYLLRS
jgi:effector-binding domain-containing protein